MKAIKTTSTELTLGKFAQIWFSLYKHMSFQLQHDEPHTDNNGQKLNCSYKI